MRPRHHSRRSLRRVLIGATRARACAGSGPPVRAGRGPPPGGPEAVWCCVRGRRWSPGSPPSASITAASSSSVGGTASGRPPVARVRSRPGPARSAGRRDRAAARRRRRCSELQPAAEGLRREPGSANTVRPYSAAYLAVMRDPPLAVASTTTTRSASAAMIRLRTGNRSRRGCTP